MSIGLSQQEYWSGLPFPPPGELSEPGIEPMSPALTGRFFTTEPPGKALSILYVVEYMCQPQFPILSLPLISVLVTISLFSMTNFVL